MEKPGDLDPAELERRHLRAEAMMKGFSYQLPDVSTGKGIVRLARTDIFRCNVQVVKKDGGENNMHYHTNGDSFWMVLKGRVRFYIHGDVVIGEFGPMQGICTPAYARYWFENAGDDVLEILHISALHQAQIGVSGRTDVSEQRFKPGSGDVFVAESV